MINYFTQPEEENQKHGLHILPRDILLSHICLRFLWDRFCFILKMKIVSYSRFNLYILSHAFLTTVEIS